MTLKTGLASALVALTLSLTPISAATAQDYTIGAIRISQPWTREPPKSARVAGGFMTITNTGTEPDRLIGGTAVFSARFEVHEMTMVDGVMRMRELKPGLDIKPGETVVLKPGSYHVMFMDLTAPPKQGDVVKGTLVFEKAGTIEIAYKVAPLGAASPNGKKEERGSGAHGHK